MMAGLLARRRRAFPIALSPIESGRVRARTCSRRTGR